MKMPKVSFHKWSGQAYITLARKRFYLGPWDGKLPVPKKIQELAKTLVGSALLGKTPPVDLVVPTEITVAEVCARYLASREGTVHRETVLADRRALAPLTAEFGRLPARDLSPRHGRWLLEFWSTVQGLTRPICNASLGKVQRMVRWAVAEELVKPELLTGFKSVALLRLGQPGTKEGPGVEAVTRELVTKTLPGLRKDARDMIEILLATGARGGEIRAMRAVDILDRDKPIWRYVPSRHKNSWRGHRREIPLGREAQRILAPYLEKNKDPNALLLKPAENRGMTNENQLTVLVGRACKALGLPRWQPRQIRKLVAQEVRDKVGLEHASALLGHRGATITAEVYARGQWARALEAAEKLQGEAGG